MTIGKKNNLQPGIVYMPYVPAETVSTVNGNFNPNLGIKSRYAVKTVNSNFYGYIRTTNLIRKVKIQNIFKIENPTD
jgi:hypothetical protein